MANNLVEVAEANLDAFLRRELAGVDLTDVRLEPSVRPYLRWGFQSRLRVIAEYGGDSSYSPVLDEHSPSAQRDGKTRR